jgi:predicted nucleotidyltransferase
LSSSVLKWPDATTVASALRRWAERAAAERPELRRVGYAGSYARGDWGVGSALDVVLVVDHARLPFWRRPVEWDLTGLPVPADVLVYTEAEWCNLDSSRRLARELARAVVWVWPG